MLIEELAIEAVGPFRERIALGPFDPGLNIIAQPNEWGKSTLIKVLSRAFFDRYTSGAEAIRQLRPAGTTLSPRVTVVFGAAGGRFRLVKRFLDGKSSELFRWNGRDWERTDESDRADLRVRELLGAPPLESSTPKPETWGFMRYLWARQDDPADWPSWDGASGEAARRRLAVVSVDPIVRALREGLQEDAAVLFTSTGRIKAGGPLERAEREREQVEQALAEVRARRLALEDLEKEHASLRTALPLLEREFTEKTAEAAQACQEAAAAEKLLAQIAQLEGDCRRADAALQQASKDREATVEITKSMEAAALERERAAAAVAEAEAAMPSTDKELQRLQAEHRRQSQERQAAEARLRRVRALARLRVRADELAALRQTSERARAAAAEWKNFEEQRERMPAATAKQIEKWRKLERSAQENRVRLETLGLRVTLRPEKAARVEAESGGRSTPLDVPAGAEETVNAARALRLRLAGWGTIEVHSGAEGVAELESAVFSQEAELAGVLAEVRAGSLAEAEANLEAARELDQRIREGRKAVAAILGDWESLAKLDGAVAKAEAAQGREHAELAPSEAETLASGAALQAEEEGLQASLQPLERSAADLEGQIEAVRSQIESLRGKREKARASLVGAEVRAKGYDEQLALLAQRHPGGLAAALEEAQREFTRAEARLGEARRQLPANAAQLPDRNARAARAAKEVEAECARKSIDLRRVETLLEERGGEGLFAREAELEEKLQAARAEATRLRDEGGAARLLCDLLQRREERAIQAVLGPLESRLSEVFAALTGVADRRVWFDELLQVSGIGPHREAMTPFAELSRGAREQLLLALRAAIALEVAAGGRECLILDDVLVHTDARRHENVLDYLQQLAGSLQIIVLTCHAERYRGVGRTVTVVR